DRARAAARRAATVRRLCAQSDAGLEQQGARSYPVNETRVQDTAPAEASWKALQPSRDQHAALRADRRCAVLRLDAPAQIHDVTLEFFVGRDLDHQPLEPNGFVGIDRSPELNPELEAHHRAALGKMRCSQRK